MGLIQNHDKFWGKGEDPYSGVNGLVKKEIQKCVLSVETEERGMIRVLMSYKKKVSVGLH